MFVEIEIKKKFCLGSTRTKVDSRVADIMIKRGMATIYEPQKPKRKSRKRSPEASNYIKEIKTEEREIEE
jgi:hypothetical protein